MKEGDVIISVITATWMFIAEEAEVEVQPRRQPMNWRAGMGGLYKWSR